MRQQPLSASMRPTPTPSKDGIEFLCPRTFRSVERALTSQGNLAPFNNVVKEYIILDHAELVLECDKNKPTEATYYFSIHAVYKTRHHMLMSPSEHMLE